MDYEYNPSRCGSPADWLLDLVSVNFTDQDCTTNETMTSEEEVVRAANLFAAEQLARNLGRPAGKSHVGYKSTCGNFCSSGFWLPAKSGHESPRKDNAAIPGIAKCAF